MYIEICIHCHCVAVWVQFVYLILKVKGIAKRKSYKLTLTKQLDVNVKIILSKLANFYILLLLSLIWKKREVFTHTHIALDTALALVSHENCSSYSSEFVSLLLQSCSLPLSRSFSLSHWKDTNTYTHTHFVFLSFPLWYSFFFLLFEIWFVRTNLKPGCGECATTLCPTRALYNFHFSMILFKCSNIFHNNIFV